MLAVIFISQTDLVARRIFSYMYSVLSPRKYRYYQDTAHDLEGVLGRTAEVWHWYRSLGRRDYILFLNK